MGNLYYDLATILQDAGLTVKVTSVNSGWERRARSSGGFSAAPLGCWWHHTASKTSPENDLDYMINGSSDAPIGNLLIDRQGWCWPIAGGASNCAGKGGPWTFSRGTCKKDSGNTAGFQIEVANAGTGSEPWPVVQIDAFFAASNALNAAVGNLPSDAVTHQAYAPDRKIDPATAAAVQGPWKPGSINSSGTWDLDDIRAECERRAGSTPPTPIPPIPGDDDDMPKAAVYMPSDDPDGPWIWWDGERCGWVRDAAWLSVGRIMGVYANTDNNPLMNFTKAQIKDMIEQSWADPGDKPPGYS